MMALVPAADNALQLTSCDIIEPITKPGIQEGLTPRLRLTFDEFLNANVIVKKFSSGDDNLNPDDSTIINAAESMRSKPETSCFSVSFAFDENFDEALSIPKCIEEIDLYTQYWPSKKSSTYLRERSKLFYGFHKGFKSRPQSTYGGLSEWIYVINGALRILLIEPTDINLAKYATLETDDDFIFQPGTERTITIRTGNFIVIPGGWISIRIAEKDTFALAGEFLHFKNFTRQLKCLANDVNRTNGKFAAQRDVEIRAGYWLTVTNLLEIEGRQYLRSLNKKDLEYLKDTLTTWRKMHVNHETPRNLYAPAGLNLNSIIRDFKSLFWERSFKSTKNSIDIISSQASTNDQPD